MKNLKTFFIYFFLVVFGIALARHFIEMPILSIAYVCLVAFIAYKIKIPKFGIVIFISAFLIRFIAIITIDTPVVSDYGIQYNFAKEIFNGNITIASTSDYMLRWGYQMGYTLFMSLLMFISKDILFIKIVNCLFTSLIALFIYLISKEITNQKVAQVISASYSFFPFAILFNTVLSNQHISSFFLLLAIYILISKKTKNMNGIKKFILIGLCLAISNIIRPGAIIFYTAIIIFLILTCEKKQYKLVFCNIIVMMVTYFAIFNTASTITRLTGVSPSGLENKMPLWEIAVGFNQETLGDYNGELANKFVPADKETKLKIVLDSTIGSFDKIPSLFLYKSQHFWLDTYLENSIGFLNNTKFNFMGKEFEFNDASKLMYSITQLYIYIFFILMILSIYKNRKNMTNEQFLMLIILLVYYGVYLLIESKPRYAYTAQIFMFIISSYYLKYLFEKIDKIVKNKKKLIEQKYTK